MAMGSGGAGGDWNEPGVQTLCKLLSDLAATTDLQTLSAEAPTRKLNQVCFPTPTIVPPWPIVFLTPPCRQPLLTRHWMRSAEHSVVL